MKEGGRKKEENEMEGKNEEREGEGERQEGRKMREDITWLAWPALCLVAKHVPGMYACMACLSHVWRKGRGEGKMVKEENGSHMHTCTCMW